MTDHKWTRCDKPGCEPWPDAVADDELYPYATLDDDNRGHEMIGFVVWYLAAFILAASFIIYAALRA